MVQEQGPIHVVLFKMHEEPLEVLQGLHGLFGLIIGLCKWLQAGDFRLNLFDFSFQAFDAVKAHEPYVEDEED